MGKKSSLGLFLLFSLSAFIYWLTSGGTTPYNYFVRLADAFLQGRYWLTEQPSWLSELVPAGPGKFYVIQPPMAAIIALPFVAFFGKNFPQQILAHLIGAGIVVMTFLLAQTVTHNRKIALWSAILSGFSSIIWYLSATGSVWYLGQLTACFFLLAAVREAVGQRRLSLVGVFIGAAYLSRIHTILAIPFFLYLLKEKILTLKNIFLFSFPIVIFLGFNAVYNFVRFGVFYDKGYYLIPGILNEPWFTQGMLNPVYLLEHLRIMFLEMPKRLDYFPFVQPSWYGLAIWITTPAFIYSLTANIKETVVKFAWLAIFLIFLLVGLRGGTGWTQFGYRYAVDFYPFLLFLTIKGVARSGLKWHHWLLLLSGIIVNLWGVIWINKFGWVSF
ncbi:MAG: hypothetical protein M1575_00720 [Patescibacteria group bacterium]|nr:hypothetical protein [Patescibacteria group bacterium]MCL5095248.1 hypothetical protein [Patescibacteria group bacterium]